LGDLRDRLTSRKFLFAVLAVLIAISQFAMGNLTANEMMDAVLVAVGVYMGAEGVADAAARLKPDIPPNPPSQ